jgi:hypothetical protein
MVSPKLYVIVLLPFRSNNKEVEAIAFNINDNGSINETTIKVVINSDSKVAFQALELSQLNLSFK